MVVVQNICKARGKIPKKQDEPHSFKVNDMVLVKDPDAAVFEPRYQPNFRVTGIFGNNRIEVQDEHGHKSIRRSSHVKYIEPSEKIVQQLLGEQVLKNYGRSSKLLLSAKDVPDLQFDVAKSEERGESAVRTDVVEIIDMDTSLMASQNSDSQEHSKNSLERAAGEASDQASEQRSIEKTVDLELHNGTSKYREHSQKMWNSEKTAAEETSGKIVARMLKKGTRPGHSENQEHSQNLLLKTEPKVDTGDVNMSFSVCNSQCLTAASEFQEVYSNLWVESECSQGIYHKQTTKSA